MNTSNPLIARWHTFLALAVLLATLGGCALTAQQKAAVSQFSRSATTLGDVTSSELIAMRGDTMKMTIERLLLGGKSKDPNLGDQTSLNRGFELKRVETVSGATRALAAYGNSLAALVMTRNRPNSKLQAMNLSRALVACLR